MSDAAQLSDDSIPAARQASKRFKVIAATSLGNGLEMFDFTVFSFFAASIGKNFFPIDTVSGPLLLAMATFGVGFIMRPLGSMLIGNYADYAGRKSALTLTILMMMAGTALIAMTPSYAQIGLAAPALVVLGRLLQGLSAGGEIGASTTFLMESGPRDRRGFMVSWQIISHGAAALLGALCGALLSATLTPAALESWGWRVPFLLGLLIGPVGLYIRRQLDETHIAPKPEHSAVREVLTRFPGRFALGILMIVSGTSVLYIIVFYMPAYAVHTLHLPITTSFLAGCASGVTMIGSASFSGNFIIDRVVHRKPLFLITSVLSLACVYPAFRLLTTTPSVGLLIAIVSVVMGLVTLGTPAFFLLVMEAFPRRVRTTALAMIYSVGVTIFGGFAQFNVTWLLHKTGDPMSPAWYLLAAGALSLIALLCFQERPTGSDADST